MSFKSFTKLQIPAEPWFLKTVCPYSQTTDSLWLFQRQNPGSVVRFLRGKKMRTAQGLYDEFVAALQFPHYFGYNGGAFDECLADLSWLPATTYVLNIFDSVDLLAEEPMQLPLFLDAFERICIEWSNPIAIGESWDRPGVPFHFIFHSTAEDVLRLPPRIGAISDLA
jgi:hypothetical protein